MEHLGKNLKKAMHDKSISAKWLAEKSGISEKTVSRILKGDHNGTTAETLLHIADTLEVSTDYLLRDTNVIIGADELQELNEQLTKELNIVREELAEKLLTIAELSAELMDVKKELKHKEEMLAVHEFYMKRG